MFRLVTASLNYSSWSMRAWLALRLAGAEFKLFDVGLKTKEGWKERILSFSGAGRVPVLIDGSLSIHESLAICEYVHERYPDAGLWPRDSALRARGRAISSEMVSSFATLRTLMPCNLRNSADHTPQSEALDADIERIFDIWEASLTTSTGNYLLGNSMTIADCMYMPVVSRFRTYGVRLPSFASRYSETIFSHPAVRELESLAEDSAPIAEYDALLES